MLSRLDLKEMEPRQRADFIFQHVQNDLSGRLWRAALGDSTTDKISNERVSAGAASGNGFDLDALMALFAPDKAAAGSPPVREPDELASSLIPQAGDEDHIAAAAWPATGGVGKLALGPNAVHEAALVRAADRTGIPASALAAIIDAEAAKGRDSQWNPFSRNPRSSAAGLGQFLSSTWVAEAQRAGTWLNDTARQRGWLDDAGRVAGRARGALLALRYDADASIQATADYAKGNLARLKRAGVHLGTEVASVAQAAYLGHHLGVGDATRFLKGGLGDGRARLLLNAQVGAASASKRIEAAGDAAAAHRTWLLSYVGKRIQPAKFTTSAL